MFDWLAVYFDLPVLDWIVGHLWNPALDILMPMITALGDAGIFWIICAAVLLCIPKYRRAGLSMGLALVFGLLLCNMTLKPLLARIRPYDYQLQFFGKNIPLLIEAQHDFSFPSGHTVASFEASVALTIRHKKLGIAALVLAVLIAFSRLYLYVHYPTDVLASMVLGTGLAFLASFLVDRLWAKKKTA